MVIRATIWRTRRMSMVGAASAMAVLLVAMVAGNAQAQGDLSNPARIAGAITGDSTKIIDLTYSFDASTIYWPTEGGFEHKFEKFGMQPGGYFYSSARFAAPEHGGTHMDAPLHFN